MAPKRREATPEANTEVCKRVKEDITTTGDDAHADVLKDKQKDLKQQSVQKTAAKLEDNTESIKNGGDKATNDKQESEDSTNNNNNNNLNGNEKLPVVESSDIKAPVVESSDEKASEKAEVDKSVNGKKPESAKTEPADKPVTSKTPEPEEEPSGTLLICGGANWDMTGRKELPKNAKKPIDNNPAAKNLWEPHRVVLEAGKNLRVKGVFSGCNACHSVVVTDDGTVMTFGRNDKGQLGLGNTDTRFTPTIVEGLKGINIVAAACGRAHTLFLTNEGSVYACGDNKMGQCGTNQPNIHQILTPNKIIFHEKKPIVKMACGAEFSMIVDIEGRLYSFGSPEHGQLGHGSEGKYFTSGNKYAFHCEHMPRRIVTFIERSRDGHVSQVDDVAIVDVACGTNHSLAVDKKNRCYSWGFGGYHRLGHSETKNELVPRSLKVFDGGPNSGRGASRVHCGATHSMAIDINGLLYFWGQNKSSGEATMYPKNVQDLCGWRVRAVACANRSIVVCADDSCISWGPSPTYGELGYGEGKSKSSTTPLEVRPLDGIHIIAIVCGYGHTLFMARDKNSEDLSRLNKLLSWP